MLNSKLKYISFLSLLLFTGCKANFDNNVILSEKNGVLDISANSILKIDNETSKLIRDNNISKDIIEIFKKNSNKDPDVKYVNNELTIKTPIILSNGSLFGIHDITFIKNKDKKYDISIFFKEPIELKNSIIKANNDKFISQIFLDSIKICNNISVSGNINTISYDKNIWNIESKFSNNISICTLANNLKENKIKINISIEENKLNYIIYILLSTIILLLIYVFRKIKK